MTMAWKSSWLFVVLLACPSDVSTTEPGPGPGEGEPCEETADCDPAGPFPLICVTPTGYPGGLCKVTCAGSNNCNDVEGCNSCFDYTGPVPYCELAGCS
jgi:hypothetical protein